MTDLLLHRAAVVVSLLRRRSNQMPRAALLAVFLFAAGCMYPVQNNASSNHAQIGCASAPPSGFDALLSPSYCQYDRCEGVSGSISFLHGSPPPQQCVDWAALTPQERVAARLYQQSIPPPPSPQHFFYSSTSTNPPTFAPSSTPVGGYNPLPPLSSH